MTSRCFGSACFDFICNHRLLFAGLLRERPLIGISGFMKFYQGISYFKIHQKVVWCGL
jgi:hypothetical protein